MLYVVRLASQSQTELSPGSEVRPWLDLKPLREGQR